MIALVTNASLLATNRALGMWVTTNDGTTVLVFNLYLFSGAPSNPDKHSRNDDLLQRTLEVIAQHGAILAIIAADFQEMPHCYSTLRDAFAAGLWCDLLVQHDDDQGISRPTTLVMLKMRPTTFARDRHWKCLDYSSWIDGILVNQHAHPFVASVEVQHALGLQHAYVIASFRFGEFVDRQRGFVWHPHAALDLSQLVPMQQRDHIAETLWEEKYSEMTDSAMLSSS